MRMCAGVHRTLELSKRICVDPLFLVSHTYGILASGREYGISVQNTLVWNTVFHTRMDRKPVAYPFADSRERFAPCSGRSPRPHDEVHQATLLRFLPSTPDADTGGLRG